MVRLRQQTNISLPSAKRPAWFPLKSELPTTRLDFPNPIGDSASVAGSNTNESAMLNDLLQATSRSFYLTLRMLPRAIRPQIGLAYLLARTTDTIADTEIIPLDERLQALEQLRAGILGRRTVPVDFGELARQQGLAAERRLLEETETALALLAALPPGDLARVRGVLATITSGQELDLRRFACASGEKIIALETAADLDDYTYRVAGCVGEFWTKMCRAHLFPEARLDELRLVADGVRFGKGLQLVNILRDLPADLQKGRCYLPAERLEAAKLRPEILLLPAAREKFRPLYREHLDQAEAHLAAGWNYTCTLPYGQFRVRLACAWPVLFGKRTIAKLRAADVAQLQSRVKISRGEVWGIILRTLLASPLPFAWRKLCPRA